MKRFKVLLGQRRFQVLATMAVLLLAASIVYASGANFTAQAANPSNVFTAGSLHVVDNGVVDGSNVVINWNNAIDPIKPGDTSTGRVVIENGGTVAGTFTLESTVSGDAGLAGMLEITVVQDKDTTPVTLVNGVKLNALAASYALTGAAWAAGASHTYDITVKWPSGNTAAVDNALMGRSNTVGFTWKAIQS